MSLSSDGDADDEAGDDDDDDAKHCEWKSNRQSGVAGVEIGIRLVEGRRSMWIHCWDWTVEFIG
jgi:hypothetical protein